MRELVIQSPSGLSGVAKSLFAAKGQFISVTFTSSVKPKAAFKMVSLTKRTQGVFRAGVNFANLKPVLEGIAEGSRGEVGSLPWGEWEYFPYTITHNGQRYIRLYPTENCQLKVQYFADGVEISREAFKGYLMPSDVKKMESGEKPLCICPKELGIENWLEPEVA
jgi:hypothetical protein